MKRLIPVLALVAACAAPEDLGVVELAVACPDGECGMNTDNMGAYFHDLKLNAENSEGFTLKKFIHPAFPLVQGLAVFNDRFYPVDINGMIVTAFTPLNTVLQLEDSAGVRWNIKITAVHNNAQYWATNPPAWVTVETYELKYQQLDEGGVPTTRYAPFCKFEPLAGHPAVTSDAVAFEGDRYYADTKKIEAEPEGSGWFNLSCLGSAPAKTFMMRHALASSNPDNGIETTISERRALLNAWTANYCGDGKAWTQTGEPLGMRDRKGWIDPASGWSWPDFGAWGTQTFETYEAAWGPGGAICLDTPRRHDKEKPGYEQVIRDYCLKTRGRPLPRCTDGKSKLPVLPSGAHILTVNP